MRHAQAKGLKRKIDSLSKENVELKREIERLRAQMANDDFMRLMLEGMAQAAGVSVADLQSSWEDFKQKQGASHGKGCNH